MINFMQKTRKEKGDVMKTSTANPAVVKKKKKGFWYVFKKNLPLTIMAAPGLIVMILFRYLPMSGLLLAFKRFSVRDGIFGSEWIGFKNFEFSVQDNRCLDHYEKHTAL